MATPSKRKRAYKIEPKRRFIHRFLPGYLELSPTSCQSTVDIDTSQLQKTTSKSEKGLWSCPLNFLSPEAELLPISALSNPQRGHSSTDLSDLKMFSLFHHPFYLTEVHRENRFHNKNKTIITQRLDLGLCMMKPLILFWGKKSYVIKITVKINT